MNLIKKKHCRYLELNDLTVFSLFPAKAEVLSFTLPFPRSQHVCRSMCLSFPTEAAESHRFSCNTLVNSPACRVIAVKAPVPVYPQFWLILSFLLMALLPCVTMNIPHIHIYIGRDTNANRYAHIVCNWKRILVLNALDGAKEDTIAYITILTILYCMTRCRWVFTHHALCLFRLSVNMQTLPPKEKKKF